MPSIDFQSGMHKSGMSLVEVMISLTIFGLLSAAIWSNVQLHGRSFIYTRASNANSLEASFVLNRLVYGGSGHWGLRIASRGSTTVTPTGLSGSEGQIGWQARVQHSVDTEDQPDLLSDRLQVVTYNPLTESIDVDGLEVGSGVTDSYFRIENGAILLGVQVETEPNGKVSLMETRIKMRNE